MDFLKQWTLSVCISLIIAVIFSLLTPKGSMNRFFRVVIAVFVFVSFVLPFQDFSADDFSLDKIGISNEIQLNQNKSVETMINGEISDFLKENGVVGTAVTSTAKYDENSGEIEVSDIQISVSDSYDKEEVNRLVFEGLGFNCRVINIGD
ncbi:MAG: hypothetical protein E7571_04385 [Ruminococcaceae bacterium]|nr:hypothetical protein [Oscillospiraceae bacterium]